MPKFTKQKRPPKFPRVKHKLPPNFAADYVKALSALSRKHKKDDKSEVKRALRLLDNLSQESWLAGRGEVWVPRPSKLSGYYPIIENVPFPMVRRATRKNTGRAERQKAWMAIAASVESFLPLLAREPGPLNRAQKRRFLSHAMVSLPTVKGRTPALLGKKVPGQLDVVPHSVVPIEQMSPEDWNRGFTMKKFSFTEDISKAAQRMSNYKPCATVPKAQAPKANLKEMVKRATDTKVHLEPENQQNAQYMFYQLHLMAQAYNFSNIERQCYENGFSDWLKKAKRKVRRLWKKSIRTLRGDVLPVAIRGATVGVAELANTEIGLSPMTVDMLPIQRIGLNQKLRQYPSRTLRTIKQDLQQDLVSEIDPVVRKGLEKGIGEIATEIAARGALLR